MLVAGEVALSTLLLVGTGLLFHTLWNLEQARLGIRYRRSDDVHRHAGGCGRVFHDDGFGGYGACAAIGGDADLCAAAGADAASVPGVRERGAGHVAAAFGHGHATRALTLWASRHGSDQHPEAHVTAVSGDYALRLGTPIVRGRMMAERHARRRRFRLRSTRRWRKSIFAGVDPLGKQINLGGKDTGMIKPYTIVGVMADQVDRASAETCSPLLLFRSSRCRPRRSSTRRC